MVMKVSYNFSVFSAAERKYSPNQNRIFPKCVPEKHENTCFYAFITKYLAWSWVQRKEIFWNPKKDYEKACLSHNIFFKVFLISLPNFLQKNMHDHDQNVWRLSDIIDLSPFIRKERHNFK